MKLSGSPPKNAMRVFGREDQADVLQAAVPVQVVAAAAVQADDLAAEVVRGGALLLDGGGDGLAGVGVVLGGHAARSLLHAWRDVGDLYQLVHLHPGHGLVLAGLGEEAVAVAVLLGQARKVLDAAARAMVIGHHQALRRDDGGRAAAGDPHRRQAHVVEPSLGRRVTVLLRDLGRGEVVEGPHALVGSGPSSLPRALQIGRVWRGNVSPTRRCSR